MPFNRALDLGREAGSCERMIERTGLSIEQVRVRVRLIRQKVGQSTVSQGLYRILCKVGIHVADYQVVIVATAGRVGRDPVGERGRRVRSRQIAIALAVVEVGVTVSIAGRTLGLEMIDYNANPGA